MRLPIFLMILMAGLLSGQTAQRQVVRATGEGSVTVRPDQVRVNVGVTNVAPTAQDAADQNAARMNAVFTALRALLGETADIRTINYSIWPQSRGDGTITGYQASNTIQATSDNINLAGRIIDTAAQAGANSIGSISFSAKDPAPLYNQALRLATQQARTRAEAMAQGLSVRLGRVVLVSESGAASPVVTADASLRATTPIQPGDLTVRAAVTVEFEILP